MFKPLLAEKADLDLLTFPMIASPKIDGIRCVIHPEHGAVSRKLKPIPNNYVREALNAIGIAGYDGELVTYTGDRIDDFNTVQSKIMRADDKPVYLFHVFDDITNPATPYQERIAALEADHRFDKHRLFVVRVPTEIVTDLAHLAEIERRYIDDLGWEGVMIRRPDGPYKFGRSTAKERILLKVKRFEDSEAVVTGTIECMHNANEAKKDALGRTERSTAKGNLIPTDSLGALSVEWNGIAFELGTGFTEQQCQDLWRRRNTLVGQAVTFKYQGVGSQGAPRFPVFLGFRFDIGEEAA